MQNGHQRFMGRLILAGSVIAAACTGGTNAGADTIGAGAPGSVSGGPPPPGVPALAAPATTPGTTGSANGVVAKDTTAARADTSKRPRRP